MSIVTIHRSRIFMVERAVLYCMINYPCTVPGIVFKYLYISSRESIIRKGLHKFSMVRKEIQYRPTHKKHLCKKLSLRFLKK